jgi:hypothetical protein
MTPFDCVRGPKRIGRQDPLGDRLGHNPDKPRAWRSRRLARGSPPLAQMVAAQGIIPRHAQNGSVQLGCRHDAVWPESWPESWPEMVRLGQFSMGRSILEPVATKFAPVNTQSHIIISQKPNGDRRRCMTIWRGPIFPSRAALADANSTRSPSPGVPAHASMPSRPTSGVAACDGDEAAPVPVEDRFPQHHATSPRPAGSRTLNAHLGSRRLSTYRSCIFFSKAPHKFARTPLPRRVRSRQCPLRSSNPHRCTPGARFGNRRSMVHRPCKAKVARYRRHIRGNTDTRPDNNRD